MTSTVDLSSLYAIPWTADNNANGWIEPTTHCQLKCPGCYRGLAAPGHVPEHRPLSELIEQVDFLEKKRNVQTISIAGGEPLMYPQLDELISAIKDRGIQVVILTNGILLDEARLLHLKDIGVDCALIHVDKLQDRTENRDEIQVNGIREKFCQLFRKIGNVQLGFIMPVSAQSISDMDILAPFFIDNCDVVEMIIFTVFRENFDGEASSDCTNSRDTEKILDSIKDQFDLLYCAYIPKLLTSDIGWIYGSTLYRDKKLWKRLTPEAFASIQNAHLKARGKYQFAPFQKRPSRLTSQGVFSQTVIVVNLPLKTQKGWNLCKGCPDAMVHDGRLVPSCLLEVIKEGEDITVYQEGEKNGV